MTLASDPTRWGKVQINPDSIIVKSGGTIVAEAGAVVPPLSVVTPITDLTNSSGGAVSNTIAAATNLAALTNNIGGTPSATLAAITQAGTAGSADFTPVQNNMNQLAVELIAQRALNTVLINAVASLASKVNELCDLCKAAGIAS